MTKYNTLNVKFFNSQLNKLKSRIKKNATQGTLNILSNKVGDSNDEINFPHNLLLTDTQVLTIRKAFANGSSANITFSKAQLSKMVQLGWFINPFTMIDKAKNSEKDIFSSVKRIDNK